MIAAPRTFGERARLTIGRALLWLIAPAECERQLAIVEAFAAESDQLHLERLDKRFCLPAASALKPDVRTRLEENRARVRARLGLNNPHSAAGGCRS
jgi:hypothetical protein